MIESASESGSRPRSILVVDDDSSVRELFAAMLEGAGHRVLQAPDGSAAIVYCRQRPVDLLITDLVMPEQEGIETIRQFVQEFPHIPIIATSGMAAYLPVAKALGAALVLEKPIAHADLLQAVRSLIG